MELARADYEVANEAEDQAWASLISTRPTTLSGALAFARHAQNYAPGNDGLIPGSTSEDAFRAIADGLEDIAAAASPEVFGHPLEDDPIFAVIAAAEEADAAMAAFDNDPAAFTAEGAREVEDQLSDAQGSAYRTVLQTAPTTTAGLRALVECTKKQIELILGHDWQTEVAKSDAGDAYLSLVATIEALHGTASEQDEPFTVESAATLSFQAYTFDASLRSPQEWGAKFSAHTLAAHIADKTLRMTKPELMAFVRSAAERGDDTDGIMLRALTAASTSFDGWAKLLHLAGSRYLIAGSSVAIEPETESGGA